MASFFSIMHNKTPYIWNTDEHVLQGFDLQEDYRICLARIIGSHEEIVPIVSGGKLYYASGEPEMKVYCIDIAGVDTENERSVLLGDFYGFFNILDDQIAYIAFDESETGIFSSSLQELEKDSSPANSSGWGNLLDPDFSKYTSVREVTMDEFSQSL